MPSITKQGKGYKITVSLGTDGHGNRVRKYLQWLPDPKLTAKQNERALAETATLFELKCHNKQTMDGNMRLDNFVEKWLIYKRTQVRPKTLALYNYLLPRVLLALGQIPLEKINPAHLHQFYADLSAVETRSDGKYVSVIDLKKAAREAGLTLAQLAATAGVHVNTAAIAARGDKVSRETAAKIAEALSLPQAFRPAEPVTLSPVTVKKYHMLLSTIFETAVDWQMIDANPCRRVKPPRIPHKEVMSLDEVGAKQLIQCLAAEPIKYRTAILLLVFGGFRRGELLGLEWQDVDLSRGLVNVCRTTQYLPGAGVFTDETKNSGSRRVVKLPEVAVNAIRALRVWQNEERLKLGDRWQDHDRLFTQWQGAPMRPDSLGKWFRQFLVRHDLPPINLHSLRHTNASLQIAGGVPLTAVADRLGHSSPAVTTSIYAHAIKSATEAAADILQDMLAPGDCR
jgi:integrase